MDIMIAAFEDLQLKYIQQIKNEIEEFIQKLDNEIKKW